jgi:hypothetical protein
MNSSGGIILGRSSLAFVCGKCPSGWSCESDFLATFGDGCSVNSSLMITAASVHLLLVTAFLAMTLTKLWRLAKPTIMSIERKGSGNGTAAVASSRLSGGGPNHNSALAQNQSSAKLIAAMLILASLSALSWISWDIFRLFASVSLNSNVNKSTTAAIGRDKVATFLYVVGHILIETSGCIFVYHSFLTATRFAFTMVAFSSDRKIKYEKAIIKTMRLTVFAVMLLALLHMLFLVAAYVETESSRRTILTASMGGLSFITIVNVFGEIQVTSLLIRNLRRLVSGMGVEGEEGRSLSTVAVERSTAGTTRGVAKVSAVESSTMDKGIPDDAQSPLKRIRSPDTGHKASSIRTKDARYRGEALIRSLRQSLNAKIALHGICLALYALQIVFLSFQFHRETYMIQWYSLVYLVGTIVNVYHF